MRTVHLGDLLVKHKVLTAAQRDQVLQAQRDRGGPFGALAEQMFGVSPAAVEKAWAEQYAGLAPHVDPRSHPVSLRALEVISRRQAWQFRVLPLEMKGNELTVCTTQDALVRALKFAGWRLGHAVQFVIADSSALGEAMEKYYPMAGMSAKVFQEPVSLG
ncbi:hypothetical protein PHYC_02412 [Phycisphaerales bacterium]|nr:hypothetical protein PHYC_02412 [Phycisphaerales bacterium]